MRGFKKKKLLNFLHLLTKITRLATGYITRIVGLKVMKNKFL